MRFEAHLRYILTTNVAAFLFAALIVLLASRIRAFISPLAVVVVILALAVAFGGEAALWVSRGIHSIELHDQTLVLYRGRKRVSQLISRKDVLVVTTRRRFMRRVVLVRLSPFHTVRITEEAFSPEVFNDFLTALVSWDRRN